MSSADNEARLLGIADRVVAMARVGEQVEAFVSRSSETDIRVYQGDVEHFVSAQSEGIGIRVIRDGRTGFAYAGTLDEAAINEVLAEARGNLEFGTPDEYAGLAEADGVDVIQQELWNEALADYATDEKIALTKELERRTLSIDSRVRVDYSNYADAAGESA
jgi:PmbA protein